MTEDPSNEKEPAALSFECNGCGQFFESWERLRQHTENPLSGQFEEAKNRGDLEANRPRCGYAPG